MYDGEVSGVQNTSCVPTSNTIVNEVSQIPGVMEVTACWVTNKQAGQLPHSLGQQRGEALLTFGGEGSDV